MPSFRSIDFKPGMNVILADKTVQSSAKDSRNGLGKSTFIELLHFCLAGKAPNAKHPLAADGLKSWEFTLEMQENDALFSMTRSLEKPAKTRLGGSWPEYANHPAKKAPEVAQDALSSLLGERLFGLSPAAGSYTPSFRSLISYVIRRSGDAYQKPNNHARKQMDWDAQLHVAFLLGLRWSDAAQAQKFKLQATTLKNIRSAVKSGIMVHGFTGTRAKLVADRAALNAEIVRLEQKLSKFQVLENYREIQDQADVLTRELHELSSQLHLKRRVAQSYQESSEQETPPGQEDLTAVYDELGVQLPQLVRKRFDEVQAFHEALVGNRKQFLSKEKARIENEIVDLESRQVAADQKRADLLSLLESHGALEEYSKLQTHVSKQREAIVQMDAQISNLERLEGGNRKLNRERQEHDDFAIEDFQERRTLVENAAAIFNEYFEALYGEPGRLLIDYKPGKGFQLDLEGNPRSGSGGVESMKIFCFDLMLARLWSQHLPTPGFLVHDSLIFDPVDERQIARALELADRESTRYGFQYICCMNTDRVPTSEFTKDFSIDPFVRMKLTDKDPAGALFGIRF
jgi:uncharacterized protein YydD (DUF2326 family)